MSYVIQNYCGRYYETLIKDSKLLGEMDVAG